MALATGANSSFLDRLYKKTGDKLWTLTCSGLQIAKQLDSIEDIVGVIVTEVVDSVLRFLPSHMPLERWRANYTNDFLGQLID